MLSRSRAAVWALCVAAVGPLCLYAAAEQTVAVKEILMPKLSSTMTEGVVSSWHKAVGDSVEVGSTLLTVESDKAEMDVESFEEGYLAKIVVPSGDTANVGSVLAYVVPSKDQIALLESAAPPQPAAAVQPAAAAPQLHSVAPHQPASEAPSQAAAPKLEAGAPQVVRRMTPEQLQDTFLSRIANNSTVVDQLRRLEQSGTNGAKLLESMKERVGYHPPPTSLLVGANPQLGAQLYSAATQQRSAALGTTQPKVEPTLAARALAAERHLDTSEVKGTGNYGRVTVSDVEAALGIKSTRLPMTTTEGGAAVVAAAAPHTAQGHGAPQLYNDIALSPSQKAIAKNMKSSLSVPVFRLTSDVPIDKLQQLYRDLKTRGVTWSTVLAKTLAAVLSRPQHSVINSHYDDATSTIKQPSAISIAMAVSTPDGGLLTPVLRDVGHRSIMDISTEWMSLVQKARDKQIKPKDCAGGTFYVSNLGTYGISQFDAILPQKAGCIMSIGAMKPTVTSAGTTSPNVNVVNEMKVTLTCDHRHINGAAAALFMKDYTEAVQSPASLLIS